MPQAMLSIFATAKTAYTNRPDLTVLRSNARSIASKPNSAKTPHPKRNGPLINAQSVEAPRMIMMGNVNIGTAPGRVPCFHAKYKNRMSRTTKESRANSELCCSCTEVGKYRPAISRSAQANSSQENMAVIPTPGNRSLLAEYSYTKIYRARVERADFGDHLGCPSEHIAAVHL